MNRFLLVLPCLVLLLLAVPQPILADSKAGVLQPFATLPTGLDAEGLAIRGDSFYVGAIGFTTTDGSVLVFDKSGGQISAPVSDGTFWGFLSTCNQLGGFSDPIVQYDRVADRWIVGEVALPAFPGSPRGRFPSSVVRNFYCLRGTEHKAFR